MSQDKDNDWTVVGTYNKVIGATKLYTLRAALVHEKPVRGQQLYQETGDWTLAPPSLRVPELHRSGRHQPRRLPRDGLVRARQHVQLVHSRRARQPRSEIRIAVHLRRALRGEPAFHERRVPVLLGPAVRRRRSVSYPERLEIRVPGKGEWLSRTHSLGLYAAGQMADDPELHPERRPSVRSPHFAAATGSGTRCSTIRAPTRSTRTTSRPASGLLTTSGIAPSSAADGGCSSRSSMSTGSTRSS